MIRFIVQVSTHPSNMHGLKALWNLALELEVPSSYTKGGAGEGAVIDCPPPGRSWLHRLARMSVLRQGQTIGHHPVQMIVLHQARMTECDKRL